MKTSILTLTLSALILSVTAASAPTRTYISYGALGRNGASKGNSGTGQVNPYNRGCTKEMRCWRDPGKRSESTEAKGAEGAAGIGAIEATGIVERAPNPERQYISYGALEADRVPMGNGHSTQANPYQNVCHEGERCWRDTGKRSEVHVDSEIVENIER